MKRFLLSILTTFISLGLIFGVYNVYGNYAVFNLALPGLDVFAAQPSGLNNPTCLDNYSTWTSSYNFKTNVPWSTAFIASDPVNPTVAYPTSGGITNSFANYYMSMDRDLNGDGLSDYIYVYHHFYDYSGTKYNEIKDCVYLNNGAGWDKAYVCYAAWDSTAGKVKFYGDCAQ